MNKRLKKSVYLDYAAATPLDPKVKKAMEPFWSKLYGNPSSLHQKGREARQAINESRQAIAKIINAKPKEVIFTAGGTESVNLAIFGVVKNYQLINKKLPHILTSAIEHDCVLNSFKILAEQGCGTSFVTVDSKGVVNMEELKGLVRPETILISLMYANNEIGTVEPIAEIGKWLKIINRERQSKGLSRIFLHTDACQAAGFLDLNVEKLGVDLMSVNGSKIYGPKQSGFLYVRSGTLIEPMFYGGDQEMSLRSGTENVAGIVGLAKAFSLVQREKDKENFRLQKLQSYLINKLKQSFPGILFNNPESSLLKVKNFNNQKNNSKNNTIGFLPNNVNIVFKDVEGEALMIYLDSYGIYASTASACSTANMEASHVLTAIGRTQQQAKSSIRFSFGKQTKKSDLDYLVKVLIEIIKTLHRV